MTPSCLPSDGASTKTRANHAVARQVRLVVGGRLAGVILLPPHRELGDVGHHPAASTPPSLAPATHPWCIALLGRLTGSSVERTATLHPLWRALCRGRAASVRLPGQAAVSVPLGAQGSESAGGRSSVLSAGWGPAASLRRRMPACTPCPRLACGSIEGVRELVEELDRQLPAFVRPAGAERPRLGLELGDEALGEPLPLR